MIIMNLCIGYFHDDAHDSSAHSYGGWAHGL